jgi:glycosyltransferase involved in cell wall biosynthesis
MESGMSLRVAHLCHDPVPYSSTSTEQVVRSCAGLASLGVRVDLFFMGSGLASQHSVQPGPAVREAVAEAYGFASGLPEGLRLIPVRQALPGLPGIGEWEVRAARLARRARYDVVLTRDLVALAWSLAVGSRAVFETYRADLQVSPWLRPWRGYCYRHPNLAGIVVHSRLAARAAASAGAEEGSVLVAYNGHAPELLEPRLGREEARVRLGLPHDRPIVVYTGHVGPEKGFEAIRQLAVRAPEALFLVVGALPGEAAAREGMERAAPAGTPNLRVLPRVPPGKVAPYLFAADCLLIPPTAGPLVRHRRTVLPMKTFLYLAAGRPILAPDLPDLREVLSDGSTAVLVPPDDSDVAAAALRRVLADAPLRESLSAAALDVARAYTWESRSRRVKAFLEAASATADATGS